MLSEPMLVTISGETFKCEGFTHKVKSAFEQYMHHHMILAVKGMKTSLGEEYSDHILKLSLNIANKLHDFGSESFFEFIRSAANFATLLHMCLSVHQPIQFDGVKKWVDENAEEALELFGKLMDAAKKK